jgi:branched-chain amino acid transport system permease protein
MLGVLFDGIAYGGLLFLVSVGLSVTLGLMNFVNLAHGAFAMEGGFVCVVAMTRLGMPFLAALPLAFVASAAAGAVLERTLYRRLYAASALDQVLFSIGLTFMAVAAATWMFGAGQQPVRLPQWLRGQWSVAGVDIGIYRAFLVATVAIVSAALGLVVTRTRFGARLRAAVDDPVAARGAGIDVDRVFSIAFALGSGLAGLGGALGIDVLGLDASFALKYMVYFLIVVVVGGAGSVKGPLVAALLLGVVDVAGKYYVPEAGAFAIYAAAVLLLVAFPRGLAR